MEVPQRRHPGEGRPRCTSAFFACWSTESALDLDPGPGRLLLGTLAHSARSRRTAGGLRPALGAREAADDSCAAVVGAAECLFEYWENLSMGLCAFERDAIRMMMRTAGKISGPCATAEVSCSCIRHLALGDLLAHRSHSQDSYPGTVSRRRLHLTEYWAQDGDIHTRYEYEPWPRMKVSKSSTSACQHAS